MRKNSSLLSYRAAQSHRGWTYMDKGEYPNAIMDFTDVLTDPLLGGEGRVVLTPGAARFADRGIAYYFNGNYDLALEDFNRPAPRFDARPHYYSGEIYMKRADYDRAIEAYTKAIEQFSDSVDYAVGYNKRGFAYFCKADYDRAREDFTKAIEFDPKYAEAYNSRGGTYYFQGDYDNAIADFTEAVRLVPDNEDLKTILEIAKRRGK
jgi:tetratricopeptide (TPR) repeat protein